MPPYHPPVGKDHNSSPPPFSPTVSTPFPSLSVSPVAIHDSHPLPANTNDKVTALYSTVPPNDDTTMYTKHYSILTEAPRYRQHGILFSKNRPAGNTTISGWRSPSKSSNRSSTSTYASPSSSSQHQPPHPRQPSARSNVSSTVIDKAEPILIHIYRARNVRTPLASNSAIIVTASLYVPVVVTDTSSIPTEHTNNPSTSSSSSNQDNNLHQVILPLRGITSQVARPASSSSFSSSTDALSPPLPVLQQVLHTLQYRGTWQRLPQSHSTPPTDAVPVTTTLTTATANTDSGEHIVQGTLLNDLVWDYKIPLLVPSLATSSSSSSSSSSSAIIVLELSDSVQTSTSAGTQGKIGTVILFPEWYPNIALSSTNTSTNRYSSSTTVHSHPSSTLRATGVLAVPNPGWHTIIPAATTSSSSITNLPELLVRIDTPSASVNTTLSSIPRTTLPPASALISSASSSSTATTSTAPSSIPAPLILPYVSNFTSPVTLVVQPHHHTVYCDRKRAVCTAAGAYREGNTLAIAGHPSCDLSLSLLPKAIVSSSSTSTTYTGRSLPETVHENVRCTWYHNDLNNVIDESDTVFEAAMTDGQIGDDSFLHPSSFYDQSNQRRFIRVASRSLSDIYTPPPIPGFNVPHDDDPRTAYQTIVQAMSASDAAHHTDSPLYSSTAANRMLRNEASVALLDPTQFPLTLIDVGRIITAIITLPGIGTFRIQHTNKTNPTIEPAPPRIREIWIEGEPKVGTTLQARTVYYGGIPGPCEYSWIRVDTEGNRTETEPKACDPFAPFPLPQSPAALLDPRCYHVTEKDIGCCFKIQCDPVRSDGTRGAPSTSKPTPDIAA